ncbi:MAG: Rpn family recombination-promoting nuclease/putative transposase, partial [Opitutales bacterium]|nr:Rpn family recombination-promoting nuclease/putative transposase [Opitutales bacterium]
SRPVFSGRPGADARGRAFARRASDLLFTVEWGGCPACLYCLFEHQSASDPKMPLRLLRYMVRIWDRWEQTHSRDGRLPLIIPVVLFQSRGGWKAPRDLRTLVRVPEGLSRDWKAFVPTFRFPVVDVGDLAAQERFAELRLRHILELLRSVAVEEDAARLEAAFAALSSLLRVQNDDLTYIRMALSYLFRASGDIDIPVFREHILKLENARLKEEAMSIAEMLRKEGREEGREEGLFAARQEVVLEALELRFGHLPVDVPSIVRSVRDASRLRDLHRAAIQAASLEAFRQSL